MSSYTGGIETTLNAGQVEWPVAQSSVIPFNLECVRTPFACSFLVFECEPVLRLRVRERETERVKESILSLPIVPLVLLVEHNILIRPLIGPNTVHATPNHAFVNPGNGSLVEEDSNMESLTWAAEDGRAPRRHTSSG